MSDQKPSLPRWLSLYFAPVIAFAIIAYYTEDTAMILVSNIVLTSLSVVVVITFTPEQVRIALDRGPMTRGAWFAYGIWWGWGAILCRAVETLVWRYMGQPLWLVNSDITSWNLWMGCIGAIGHIVKPGDLAERLPRREIIRIACIVGFGVFVGLAVVEWADITAAWNHQKAVWFRTPGIESAVAGPPPKAFARAAEVPRSLQDLVHSPDDYLRRQAEADAERHAPRPARRDAIPLGDMLRNDDAGEGRVRVETTLSPRDAERLEQSRVAHGDRSRAAALRRLIPQGLDGEDRDALGVYDPAVK